MHTKTIEEFMGELSTKAPVPGGGGAAAVAASMSAALGAMVANLTTGKKKYAEYQEEIERLIDKLEDSSKELMLYMNKDAEAFEPLSRAYGLKRDTKEQIEERDKIMEKCLLAASSVPLELMEKICVCIKDLNRLSEIGTKIAISDVGVGAQMARAALLSASMNVYINTKLMKNREVAKEMEEKTEKLLKEGVALADETFEKVQKAICG